MRKLFQKEKEILLENFNYTKNMYVKTPANAGIVILEKEPHARTVFLSSNRGSSRVFFPYVQFYIRYTIEKEKYIYHGITSNGLKVSFSNSPVKNMKDIVYIPPPDYLRDGFVCTPHVAISGQDTLYDNKKFNDLETLQKQVVGTYWSLNQDGINWINLTQEEVLEKKWCFEQEFQSYANQYCSNCLNFSEDNVEVFQ